MLSGEFGRGRADMQRLAEELVRFTYAKSG